MAVSLEVKYAAALTREEQEMLSKIEEIVKDAAWHTRQVLVTKWVPKEDKGKRVLYCLVNSEDSKSVLAYYRRDEVSRLIQSVQSILEQNLLSRSRTMVPEGFTDRPCANL
jgi:hypothetical protein